MNYVNKSCSPYRRVEGWARILGERDKDDRDFRAKPWKRGPRLGRRKRKRMTEIKRTLAESFKELVKEKGLQKIIVKDITDRAKVKRPTFYSYFKDKYDVVEWIYVQEIWQPSRSLLEGGYSHEALRFILVSMEKDKEYYRKLLNQDGQNSFGEIVKKYIREESEKILRENGKKPPHRLLTPEIMAEYLGYIFWFLIKRWLSSPEEISALEVIEVYQILKSDSLDNIFKK